MLEASLELDRLEGVETEVIEEIFTEVERSEMSTTDQQQHRTNVDVAAADRPAQAKGLVGFVAGHDDCADPAVGGLLASRRVEIGRCLPRPATQVESLGELGWGGRGEDEKRIHRAHQLPR